jgi:hypothetical protein
MTYLVSRVRPARKKIIVWPLKSQNQFLHQTVPNNYLAEELTLYNLLFSGAQIAHFHWIEYLFNKTSIFHTCKYVILICLLKLLRLKKVKLIYTVHNLIPNHVTINCWHSYVKRYNNFLSLIDAAVVLNPETPTIAAEYLITLPKSRHQVWHGFVYPDKFCTASVRDGIGIFGSASSYKNNSALQQLLHKLQSQNENIEFFGIHWRSYFPDLNVIDENELTLSSWLSTKKFIIVPNTSSLNSGVLWHSLQFGANIICDNPNLKKSVPCELRKYIRHSAENLTYIPIEPSMFLKYGKRAIQDRYLEVLES